MKSRRFHAEPWVPGPSAWYAATGVAAVEISSNGAVLVLDGDFDVRSTFQVRAALHDHLARHAGTVVVDLSHVGTVDVTALKVLAFASRRVVREGQHLRLRGCGPAVRRMLHKSHLIRLVEVERGAASA